MSSAEACSCRHCHQPAVGTGPFSGLSMCHRHWQLDVERVKQRQSQLVDGLKRISSGGVDKKSLRTELQSLEAEQQQVDDTFESVRELLQRWQDRIVLRLQEVRDLIAQRLQDVTEAEQFEKEVATAADAGNMRTVMELSVTIESWLGEATERLTELGRVRSDLQDRRKTKGSSARLVGDLSGGVQQLLSLIDSHMTGAVQQCGLSGGSIKPDPGDKPGITCKQLGTADGLENYPYCLALCTNTLGFSFDASSRRVTKRSESADHLQCQLPQPCIFVSFGNNSAHHLLIASLDGASRLKCCCAGLDWSQLITGLHCDSQRQQVFVAQPQCVTVTDLSGATTAVQLRQLDTVAVGCIADIDGNVDKVFLLDSRDQRVIISSKDTGQLESVVSLRSTAMAQPVGQGFKRLAVLSGSKLLVASSDGQLCKACGISGQAIDCFAACNLHGCVSLTADSDGMVAVGSNKRHVTVLRGSDGSVLLTLGSDAEAALSCPCGLAVVGWSPHWLQDSEEAAVATNVENFADELQIRSKRLLLAVADRDKKRLVVFELIV